MSLGARRRTYVRLIGEIRHALNNALQEEFQRRQLTSTGMADILEKDKSFVSRKLNGTSNMTLETLADLAFALDRVIKIQLVPRTPPAGSNSHVAPTEDKGIVKSSETKASAGARKFVLEPA
ncbi:MAG TPA: hypothetical protein VK629_16530 [Steroidobacteraceae bacterium]|nr:hypothetical protein [Steroidobacteraceae bacterium]